MKHILEKLPNDLVSVLLDTHILSNVKDYREKFLAKKNLDSGLDFNSSLETETPKFETKRIIWATENYLSVNPNYEFSKEMPSKVSELNIIVPRIEKSKDEQKKRIKEKAEVFTPSWVCNLQNNLIDDEVVGKGAFNRVSEDQKTWIPSKSPVKFKAPYTWMNYVVERRLEACCGEGPYLFSPYDTVSGELITVKDSKERFQRIGIIDRKLRVVTENVSKDDWFEAALVALKATFGYEWQGDNLFLTRLNAVSTFVDYYEDALKEFPSIEELAKICEIVSWNFWQMDGLKQTVPETCNKTNICVACEEKKKAGHNGEIPVIRFQSQKGYRIFPFEEMLPKDYFPNRIDSSVKIVKKLQTKEKKEKPEELGLF